MWLYFIYLIWIRSISSGAMFVNSHISEYPQKANWKYTNPRRVGLQCCSVICAIVLLMGMWRWDAIALKWESHSTSCSKLSHADCVSQCFLFTYTSDGSLILMKPFFLRQLLKELSLYKRTDVADIVTEPHWWDGPATFLHPMP